MPDDAAGEKTEPATPRRREESREKGQVARSMDLSSAVLLLVSFALLFLLGSRILRDLGGVQGGILGRLPAPAFGIAEVTAMARSESVDLFLLLFPFLLGIVIAAVAVNLLQVGFLFTLKPLVPDFNKINPLQGVKKLFSLQGIVRMLMSLFKIAVIVGVIVLIFNDEVDGFLLLPEHGVLEGLVYVSERIFWAAMKVGLAVLALALLDFAYQKWQHEHGMRMSKQEVKEEMKRMEGDPQIRQRRLALQRQLSRQRMMKSVEKADVVITNPTERAVALKYDVDTMHAPRVTAKGARKAALRIRELAMTHGVPIVERPPLARAIYDACEVGQFVPEDLYAAVAEVLRYVYELEGRSFAA